MDIELVKTKLARVGLPLHGTEHDLVNRAAANALIPEGTIVTVGGKDLNIPQGVVTTGPSQELEQRDRAAEAKLADETMDAIRAKEANVEIVEVVTEETPVTVIPYIEPKRGRPKKGK